MVRDRSSESSREEPPLVTQGESTAEVTGTVSSGVNVWMMAGIAAALVVIIGLPVLLGARGADDEVVAGSGSAEEAGLTTASTAPGAAVRYVDETPAATTTTRKSRAIVAPPTSPPITLPAGQFVLGEATGLWLFYGGDDPLQRLNLDNGELIEVGVRAVPVTATGEDVVLFQPASGVFGWVLAKDPGEQSLGWRWGPVAMGPESGQLWILDTDRDIEHPAGVEVGSGRWELFDIETVRVLERRPGEQYEEVEASYDAKTSLGREPWSLRPSPDLSLRPDGIHAYQAEGYRRLRSGWVLTSDDDRALIEVCDDADSCRSEWMSLPDGGPLNLPVPTGDVSGVELVAGGAWLRWSEPSGQIRFLELGTGQELVFSADRHAELSPTGRWLAAFDADQLEIYDVLAFAEPEPEPVARLDVLNRRGGGELLFVDRGD